jgi:hypothetical protein
VRRRAQRVAARTLRPMIGTLARVAMLRFMPRRLVPFLAAWQVISMLRSRNKRRDDASTREASRRR